MWSGSDSQEEQQLPLDHGGRAAATLWRGDGVLSQTKVWYHLDPAVSSTAWGFECHSLADVYIPGVSVEHVLKLSVYSAQPPLAGCFDKLLGYSELWSQQCHWHHATRGLAWQLQMRPRGWDWRGGMGKALDFLWAWASLLKRVLQDGRWRSQSSLGHSEESNSSAATRPTIIWLLSLQVPPVESKCALPDGQTGSAQRLWVFSGTASDQWSCGAAEALSRGLFVVLALDALLHPHWREHTHRRVFDSIGAGNKWQLYNRPKWVVLPVCSHHSHRVPVGQTQTAHTSHGCECILATEEPDLMRRTWASFIMKGRFHFN